MESRNQDPVAPHRKILLVAPTLATFPFLRPLCERLIDDGWDVHLATSRFQFGKSAEVEPPIQHHLVGFPRGADLKGHFAASREMRKLIDELRPDLIDVHFSAAMLTTALAKQKHWPPTVATVQGWRFPMQDSFIRRRIEKFVECWSARKMDEVMVLTQDDYEATRHQLPNSKKQTAPGFGCDLTRFDPGNVSASRRKLARQRAGLQAGELPMIYVGRRTSFKGFDLVIRAFLEAQQELPKLRLIVCGDSDPLHPSGLSRQEEQWVKANDQITELGWVENVEDYLSISEFTVFPSRREGMAVNLMESLAMGVPVITCDSRGCRDVVDQNFTGLVLPEFDAHAISEAMVTLAKNHDQRQEFARNALAIRKKFDQAHFVDERISTFTRLTLRD